MIVIVRILRNQYRHSQQGQKDNRSPWIGPILQRVASFTKGSVWLGKEEFWRDRNDILKKKDGMILLRLDRFCWERL